MIPRDSPACPPAEPLDLIVNFAPTGARLTREDNPHIPLSSQEIVEAVHEAVELGITMVHLHARDARGVPTSDPDVYAAMIGAIRSFAPDLIICVSTTGAVSPDLETRALPLRLDGDVKPDMASLTLGSLNFARTASMNDPETIGFLAREMQAAGIAPELEVFGAGMLTYAAFLIDKGLLAPPHYVNVFIGGVTGVRLDLLEVGLLLRNLPAETVWSLAGLGRAQAPTTALAVAVGGGIRIGLEDGIWMDGARTIPATNRALLERVHRLAAAHQRAIMTPDRLRRMLDLRRPPVPGPEDVRWASRPPSAAPTS